MADVLVVDDDPSIRQVIRFTLEDEGHTVAEAADGETAFLEIERQHPELILVDLKMPGMDGREFVQRYRTRFGQRAALVVLSASQTESQSDEVNGAERYIAKPFDLDVLIDTVAGLFTLEPLGHASP